MALLLPLPLSFLELPSICAVREEGRIAPIPALSGKNTTKPTIDVQKCQGETPAIKYPFSYANPAVAAARRTTEELSVKSTSERHSSL